MPNGQLSAAALCYKPNPRGTVVQQSLWQPAQRGDMQRHVDDAALVPPVFFIRPSDFVVGLPMSYVLNAPPGSPFDISNSDARAPLGGFPNTHFCLMVSEALTLIYLIDLPDENITQWPGYPEYRKQVELRNTSRVPITMSRLVMRIARFVERFVEVWGRCIAICGETLTHHLGRGEPACRWPLAYWTGGHH